MSQNFDSGPFSFYFTECRNLHFNKFPKSYPISDIKEV